MKCRFHKSASFRTTSEFQWSRRYILLLRKDKKGRTWSVLLTGRRHASHRLGKCRLVRILGSFCIASTPGSGTWSRWCDVLWLWRWTTSHLCRELDAWSQCLGTSTCPLVAGPSGLHQTCRQVCIPKTSMSHCRRHTGALLSPSWRWGSSPLKQRE